MAGERVECAAIRCREYAWFRAGSMALPAGDATPLVVPAAREIPEIGWALNINYLPGDLETSHA